ncbi:hypothetical protein [Mycoplasmopsis gallinarum]|uniref:hypothetical protein n=1 Tax=Mycoplasmopsis gallinarum TaxID=29557 RepID=UPI000560FAD1|nr:hypothetical protein [Mycoplasmopsis gallinarum]
MKIINDQFYTKENVVELCKKSLLQFNNYDVFIEPSAGEGAFLNIFANTLAYDIDPKQTKIMKQDFLELDLNFNNKKVLVFGNPPFGSRSILAKKFIKKSISLGANAIAFILPNIFKKAINQTYRLFPEEWKLINIIDLPKESFYVYDKNQYINYHVPCSFFVWIKNDMSNLPNLRKNKINLEIKEFIFVKRNSSEADLTINGNSGKVRFPHEITNPKSEHFIKINTNFDLMEIKEKLNNLIYPKYSSVTGGNYWINQDQIKEAWIEKYYK